MSNAKSVSFSHGIASIDPSNLARVSGGASDLSQWGRPIGGLPDDFGSRAGDWYSPPLNETFPPAAYEIENYAGNYGDAMGYGALGGDSLGGDSF